MYEAGCIHTTLLGPFFFLHPFFQEIFGVASWTLFTPPMGCFFFFWTQQNPPPNWPDNAAKNGFCFVEIWVQMCSSTLNADNGGRKKGKRRVTEVFQTYCLWSFRRKKTLQKVIGWYILDILANMSSDVMRKSCWASLLIILGFGGVSYEASHSSHADVSIRQLATTAKFRSWETSAFRRPG